MGNKTTSSYNIRGTTSIGQGGVTSLSDGVEGDPSLLNLMISSVSVLKMLLLPVWSKERLE